MDWEALGVGPPETWPRELDSALRLILTTRFPATLLWGPDLLLLYNEAYVSLIADKHPDALGRPVADVFPEIWASIGPLFDVVISGAGPTWVEDQQLLMRRRGFFEEGYFTYSYSPVLDPDGVILGVLDIATETTRQVIDDRRLRLLSRLGDALRDLADPADLPGLALPLLRAAVWDLPSVDIALPAAAPADLILSAGEVSVPIGGRTRDSTGVLRARLSEHLAPDDAYLGFLRLVGDALSSALAAAEVRRSEQRAALAHRSMSETLQRSLLTDPVQPAGMRIAARYRTAEHEARVGGDWYDAFTLPDGTTCLVVGDVAGHDRTAAALMGQVRNVLRGTAYALPDASPATVLTALDRAVRGLAVGTLATALLAVLGPDGTLRWSNAGHPPPLLLTPDGGAQVLDTRPELLLGVNPGTTRTDHTTTLPPGGTLLLYTDGLVERRAVGITDGIAWLTRTAAGLATAPLDTLCDRLLVATAGHAEDDIALLAVRA
jgi:serine phosphatase RsbU (regulator of sigma subunit)